MKYTFADDSYAKMLDDVLTTGNRLRTRNSDVYSLPGYRMEFSLFPIITIRKTAWKKALEEMEWFLSGEEQCPENFAKTWWTGQLNPEGKYISGYATQFRKNGPHKFDQIGFLLNALKTNPNSRRLILTSWDSHDMANITKINENPNTPTTCHNTMSQFFVRDGGLHLVTYQRSCDALLGLPHNLVQTYSLLEYLACHSGLSTGKIIWNFGDLHIYDEPSHIETAKAMIEPGELFDGMITPELKYDYSGEVDAFGTPKYKASDFSIIGDIPKPTVLSKPKLL